jgi:hypothetical protein
VNKIVINLTPHDINVVLENEVVVYPKSGAVARCAETSVVVGTLNGVPIVKKEFGGVENLPPYQEGTFYVVSALVASAVKRADVVSPGDAVRDENGVIIGCKSLCSYK